MRAAGILAGGRQNEVGGVRIVTTLYCDATCGGGRIVVNRQRCACIRMVVLPGGGEGR